MKESTFFPSPEGDTAMSPLQQRMLEDMQLRGLSARTSRTVTCRCPQWLFPAPTRHGLAHSLAHDGGPVTRSSLQSAFRSAVQRAGIAKRAHVHTLRHSYATHLLEANFNLRVIQDHLGHRSPRTTALYTHLTHAVRAAVTQPLNQLMEDL